MVISSYCKHIFHARSIVMQESGVELEEHDDFQSFDFGPRNVATIAEEEATALT